MQEVLWLERLERQLLRPTGATRIHYDLHLGLTSGKVIIEGSLEVKLPTIWADEKAEVGRVREEKKRRSKKIREENESEERRCRCVNHCVFHVFPIFWGSRGSKSRLAKAAGAEPSGEIRDKQLHTVVAQITFPSQNVQNTPVSEHFWKLR